MDTQERGEGRRVCRKEGQEGEGGREMKGYENKETEERQDQQ